MKKGEKKEESAVHKSIPITSRHQKFIDDRSLNLSKFVQKKLDGEIDMQGWKGG